VIQLDERLRAVVEEANPTVTPNADDVNVAYELLVGVKVAVMLWVPVGSELVVQVAVPTPGEAVVPAPLTVVA
jgi:hypothetical protein